MNQKKLLPLGFLILLVLLGCQKNVDIEPTAYEVTVNTLIEQGYSVDSHATRLARMDDQPDEDWIVEIRSLKHMFRRLNYFDPGEPHLAFWVVADDMYDYPFWCIEYNKTTEKPEIHVSLENKGKVYGCLFEPETQTLISGNSKVCAKVQLARGEELLTELNKELARLELSYADIYQVFKDYKIK